MSKIDFYNTLIKIAGEDAANQISGKHINITIGDTQSRKVKTAIQSNEMTDKTANPVKVPITQPSPYRRSTFRI